jgi:hypothetical protein
MYKMLSLAVKWLQFPVSYQYWDLLVLLNSALKYIKCRRFISLSSDRYIELKSVKHKYSFVIIPIIKTILTPLNPALINQLIDAYPSVSQPYRPPRSVTEIHLPLYFFNWLQSPLHPGSSMEMFCIYYKLLKKLLNSAREMCAWR